MSTDVRRRPALPGGRVLSDGHVLYWWVEILLIIGFYVVYSQIRNLSGNSLEHPPAHALEHAKQIIELEQRLVLFHEHRLQDWAEHFTPLIVIGSTWSIKTAGTKASTAAIGTSRSSARNTSPNTAITESWYTNAVPNTRTACAGWCRKRSAPMCTAPMKLVQFSRSAKRPANRGWLTVSITNPSSASVITATRSASQDCGSSRSDGRIANPNNTVSGSTRNPVSRSSATEPNAVRELTRLDARETRSTSPPIVVGRTVPMNKLAK